MTDDEIARLTRMRDRASRIDAPGARLLTQVLYDLRTLRKGEELALRAAHEAMPGESFSCSQEAMVVIVGDRDQLLVDYQRAAGERDAAQAAYACVCEAVTPGSVGGAEATAIMAQVNSQGARRCPDSGGGAGEAGARAAQPDRGVGE